MSSLTIDKSGKTIGYNIQWCEDGRRYTIYLGGRRYNKKTAEACQECIDALLYYQRNNIITPDRKIEDWLQSAPVHLRSKLAKAGLIPASKSKTWRELWDSFLVDRQHAKPATLCKYRSCQKLFYKAFSPTECIADITSDSLLNWKHSLLQRCKPGGVETRLAIIDTILNWAIARGATGEETFERFKTFLSRLWKESPQTEFFFVSGTRAPSRARFHEQAIKFDSLVRELVEKTPKLHYINTFPTIAGADDRGDEKYFKEDRLHLNREGEKRWIPVITKALREAE